MDHDPYSTYIYKKFNTEKQQKLHDQISIKIRQQFQKNILSTNYSKKESI